MAALSTFTDGQRLNLVGPGDWVANPTGIYYKSGTIALRYRTTGTSTVAAFTDLTDGISSYTGLGGRPLRVNAAETGLEAANSHRTFTATEAISSGMLVNIIAGTSTVRKADASLSREANGYVITTVALGGSVEVYTDGHNDQLTGLTIGPRWLSTNGGTTSTKPTSGMAQFVGEAVSSTHLAFDPDAPIVLV